MNVRNLERDQIGNGVKAFCGGGQCGVHPSGSFPGMKPRRKCWKLWLELLSLQVEVRWLSRLETRRGKALPSGQRQNYLDCSSAFDLGNAGVGFDFIAFSNFPIILSEFSL